MIRSRRRAAAGDGKVSILDRHFPIPLGPNQGVFWGQPVIHNTSAAGHSGGPAHHLFGP
jgi:hypothetical protein